MDVKAGGHGDEVVTTAGPSTSLRFGLDDNLFLLADVDFHAVGGVGAPGHAGRIVGDAEPTEGTEQDDAAVAAQAVEEVGDGFLRGLRRGRALLDAIDGPLAEHQFHDGLSPTGERNRGG